MNHQEKTRLDNYIEFRENEVKQGMGYVAYENALIQALNEPNTHFEKTTDALINDHYPEALGEIQLD